MTGQAKKLTKEQQKRWPNQQVNSEMKEADDAAAMLEKPGTPKSTFVGGGTEPCERRRGSRAKEERCRQKGGNQDQDGGGNFGLKELFFPPRPRDQDRDILSGKKIEVQGVQPGDAQSWGQMSAL